MAGDSLPRATRLFKPTVNGFPFRRVGGNGETLPGEGLFGVFILRVQKGREKKDGHQKKEKK